MEKYEEVERIGKGSFGIVSKVRRKSDGNYFVWKEMEYTRMNEREKQQLVAEVNILREFNHPNIVKYYDRIIDKKEGKIFIVMEYCEGGDLSTMLKKCRKEKDYIAEDVIWKVFTQIVLALKECHYHKNGKILHRDIKPANIFLDGQSNIKLGDFGLARIMSEDSVFACTNVGTPYYMSPEQINEMKYNEKSDIWSLGCLLYEMAALKPPFEAGNHLSLAIKIRAGKYERIPLRFSEDLMNLITKLLLIDSINRPGIIELLNHPIVKIRVKERELREKMSKLSIREEAISKMEKALKEDSQEKYPEFTKNESRLNKGSNERRVMKDFGNFY